MEKFRQYIPCQLLRRRQLYCSSTATTAVPRSPAACVKPPASCAAVPGIRPTAPMVIFGALTGRVALVSLPGDRTIRERLDGARIA